MLAIIVDVSEIARQATVVSRGKNALTLGELKDKHLGSVEDKTATPRYIHFYASTTPGLPPNLFAVPLEIDEIYGPLYVLASKHVTTPKSLTELLPMTLIDFDEAKEANWWSDPVDDLDDDAVLDEAEEAEEEADAAVDAADAAEELEEEADAGEDDTEAEAKQPAKKSRSRVPVSRMLQVINEASTGLTPLQKRVIDILEEAFPGQDSTALQRSVLRACIKLAGRMQIAASWDEPVFEEVYKRQVYTIVRNAAAILAMLPCDVGSLTPEELCPERWLPIKQKRLDQDRQREEEAKASMSSTPCRKCGVTGFVSYIDIQTRGGDEGMTTFYTCNKCGGVWKN